MCSQPTASEYAIEKLELSDEVDETSVVIESTSRQGENIREEEEVKLLKSKGRKVGLKLNDEFVY